MCGVLVDGEASPALRGQAGELMGGLGRQHGRQGQMVLPP